MDKKHFVFTIKKSSHIINMNKKCNKYNVSQEILYVANELADNMLKAQTSGTIEIFPEEEVVINIIQGDRHRFKELKMFLSIARYVYNNKETIIPTNTEYSSKGFLSIFFSDWLIDAVNHNYVNYEIIARKCKK